MSDLQIGITVLLLASSVWITRFLPFIIFKKTDRLPKAIDYLGTVLPAAMMGLLVVYCFKDFSFTSLQAITPAAVSVAAVAALQLWQHKTVLSIFAGTALYMLLIRLF